jgi:hypothetical protein
VTTATNFAMGWRTDLEHLPATYSNPAPEYILADGVQRPAQRNRVTLTGGDH